MGKRKEKKIASEMCAVTRDGELCGVGMTRQDAETFISESSATYPESSFKMIPHPKEGKR